MLEIVHNETTLSAYSGLVVEYDGVLATAYTYTVIHVSHRVWSIQAYNVCANTLQITQLGPHSLTIQ